MSSIKIKPSSAGSQHNDNGGAAAVLGSTLTYFGSSNGNNLKIVSFDCTGLQSGNLSSVGVDSNWTKQDLKESIVVKNGASLKAELGTAAVTFGDRVYMFWADGTGSSGDVYMAYRNSDGTFGSTAYSVIATYGSGPKAYNSKSSLAAALSPDGTKIVLLRFGLNSTTLYSLVLDPSDIDFTAGSWTGRIRRNITLNDVDSSIDDHYKQLSAAWYTQGDKNWMVASLYSEHDNKLNTVAYPIGDDGAPASSDDSQVISVGDYKKVKTGCSLTRDPGGRIIAIIANNSRQMMINTYNTLADPSAGSPWSKFSALFGKSNRTDVMGVPIFVAASDVSNQTVTGTINGSSKTYRGTTTRNQYLIVIYDDNIKVIADFYGKATIVPGVSTVTPTSTNTRLLAMLMDSFPFPDQNLGSLAPSQINSPIITYTYGASSESETSFGMKGKLQFGIKSEFDAYVTEESEFRAGPMGEISYSVSAESTEGFNVHTTPITDTDQQAGVRIARNGEYYGSTLPDIVEDATIFVGSDGVVPNGVTAPLFSALRTVKDVSTHRVSGQFSAYTYTPGNIQSYQKSKINSTVGRLYGNLSSSQQANLSAHYASNYMDGVVLPNAQSLGANNYLEFTLDGSGEQIPKYRQIDEAMALLGISVEGSMYVGESTEATIGILVVEETISEEFLAGLDFSMELTTETTAYNSWGISASVNTPEAVDGSYVYTVRMYVLKPSNLWARELQYFGDPNTVQNYGNIDFDTSKPSKIMFEVLDIQPVISA